MRCLLSDCEVSRFVQIVSGLCVRLKVWRNWLKDEVLINRGPLARLWLRKAFGLACFSSRLFLRLKWSISSFAVSSPLLRLSVNKHLSS